MFKKGLIFSLFLVLIFSLFGCDTNQGYVDTLSEKNEKIVREKVLSDDNKNAKIYFYGQYDEVLVIGYTNYSFSSTSESVVVYNQYIFDYSDKNIKMVLFDKKQNKVMSFNNYFSSKKVGSLEKDWIDEKYFENIQQHFIVNHAGIYADTDKELGALSAHQITSKYVEKYVSTDPQDVYYKNSISNYYGKYNDYQVVVMYSKLFTGESLTTEKVNDLKFITSPGYVLKLYKDGEFFDLSYVFENNLISLEELNDIYNQHKKAFVHLYLFEK
ncbi:MAG: hypothetical protein IJX78_06060 [Bacilli bacterium]|nr:hypothetical protein [Bacilli bacterium]